MLGAEEPPAHYRLGPDSVTSPGVPQGSVTTFELVSPGIFPGAVRTITLYIPDQYTPDRAACVYVGLDGLAYNIPDVFNNLIARGEMPVTIGIGLGPGKTPSARSGENPRFNRSFEFDSLNPALARYIEQELFPAVEARRTRNGLPIRLSRDPNDHAAGGSSTGGIGSFTLGWQRPDLFRRLFISIGTFVGMRGGDGYPVLVRKTEPKPLRVFLQDGSNDQWMGGPEFGDWWMSNQTLQRALEFAGYENKYIWGTGSHSSEHAAAIFPDAMRYLWHGWPAPIAPGTARTNNTFLHAVLDPREDWQEVPATLPVGEIKSRLDGSVLLGSTAANQATFLRIAPDGTAGEALASDEDRATRRPAGFGSGGDAPSASGDFYITETTAGKLWRVRPDGRRELLDADLNHPTAVALSPDGLWLAVMESRTHFGYSYRVRVDGSVDLRERFYWLHGSDEAGYSDAGNMIMDREGRGYIATNVGVQIVDRNGRSRAILPGPVGTGGAVTRLAFGGDPANTLYIVAAGKLYRRHVKVTGAIPGAPPITLPPGTPG